MEQRRHVSVMFADMVGYTAALEPLDPEEALSLTREIYDFLCNAVHAEGGRVSGFGGDSIMGIFGLSERHENPALNASHAALAVHEEFDRQAAALRERFGILPSMRVGISTGHAIVALMDDDGSSPTLIGHTVNLASRIEGLAGAGNTLICDTTRSMLAGLAEVEHFGVKTISGITKPQTLWKLKSIVPGATRFDASRARGLSLFVGRDSELDTILTAHRDSKKGHVVVDVVAEPGSGKSRLVHEFLERIQPEEPRVFLGQCAADGGDTAFLPFEMIVRAAFGIRETMSQKEIASHLSAGLKASGLASAENQALLLNFLGLKAPSEPLQRLDSVLIGLRTRDLLQALLEESCKSGPVIMVMEDIHWIDQASANLLERIIENEAVSNLLIIHTRRTGYPMSWEDCPSCRQIRLRPLGEKEIGDFVAERLDVPEIPADLERQLAERSGGNPLFAEEIVQFLLETGALIVTDGKATFDTTAGAATLPTSVTVLLAARVDGLTPDQRRLLQVASAIGRRFDTGLLDLVMDDPAGVRGSLHALSALDMLRQEEKDGATEYVFKHALLQDCVYDTLLNDQREALHLKIAESIEKRSGERPGEAAAQLAYHFGLTKCTERAFYYSVRAGRRSMRVFSLGEAENAFVAAFDAYHKNPDVIEDAALGEFLADYARCLDLSLKINSLLSLADEALPIFQRVGDSRARAIFMHHFSIALTWNGRFPDGYRAACELVEISNRLDDPVSDAYGRVTELAISIYAAPKSNAIFAEARQRIDALLAEVDDPYLDNFHRAHMGWDAMTRGRVNDARLEAEKMIAHGHATNDPRALGYGTAMLALIAMLSDDYATALQLSELAHEFSRVEFEKSIASAARFGALIPSGKLEAAPDVAAFVDSCRSRGLQLILTGPEPTLAIARAIQGDIDEAVKDLEAIIAGHDAAGRVGSADLVRFYLCELYLSVLFGEGDASLGVLWRNRRSILRIMLSGEKTVARLVEKVRENPQYDADGHYVGRCEMLLGLLYAARKKRDLARVHLGKARQIIVQFGPSPMLQRIEKAYADCSK
ncbi:ATP-binding protein [Shimia biformata]|uniref:ATP-binding protein n=1 Tax=Shimia biformata TaxID=1294299 RepID=UPI0019512AC5|nr:adenylate/guanylate cyclase domain-containing protein [Shimia biformata]